MSTKQNPGKFDCYANALPDEPQFTLLARDPHAPILLRAWANLRLDAIVAGERPDEDYAMVSEARTCAQAMIDWRVANWPRRKP